MIIDLFGTSSLKKKEYLIFLFNAHFFPTIINVGSIFHMVDFAFLLKKLCFRERKIRDISVKVMRMV